METPGAIEMLLRSIDKYVLWYATLVVDRDSNCRDSVCETLKKNPTCYSYEVETLYSYKFAYLEHI